MTKRKLWRHQAEDLAASRDMPAAALHWDPRCGKSRVAIETALHLAGKGDIDCALVIAPNGVHLNWTREELPRYWTGDDSRTFEWDSGRTQTKKFQWEAFEALNHDGFLWIAANIEALGVKESKLRRFLDNTVKKRRVLLIVDESHAVKNPKARRTKALMAIAKHCPYRRELTGTPVAQGPFDLWSQYYVLDPSILGERFVPFKTRYGVFRKMRYGAGPTFDELVEYRNLDDLTRRIAPITFVRKKRDVLKNLPERPDSVRRHFVMPPAHRRVYDQMRDDLIARLDEDTEVSAPRALTNLLRLQQISRGNVTLEDGSVRELGEPYPAAEETLRLVTENDGKTVIWCRFVADVNLLHHMLGEAGIAGARCDGSTPAAERPELRARFREDKDLRYWLGTAGTGGVGVSLAAANLMVFYSHGYDLVQRVQAMERNYEEANTAEKIWVVDMVAADTVDHAALAALDRKENLAATLSGARLKEILTDGN